MYLFSLRATIFNKIIVIVIIYLFIYLFMF